MIEKRMCERETESEGDSGESNCSRAFVTEVYSVRFVVMIPAYSPE